MPAVRAGMGDPGFGLLDRRRLMGRAVWSVLGQTISSGSNFLLSVLVLSVARASEFATFAICATTYGFVLQLCRATVGVPITLFYSDGAGVADPKGHRSAVGLSVAVGLLVGAAAAGVAAFSADGTQLLVLGASLPFLLWQDMVRYVCFAHGRPAVAAGADALWFVLQVLGSAVVLAAGRGSATTLLAVWAGAGTISALVTGVRLGMTPRFAAAVRWGWTHHWLIWRLLAEFVVAAGSHYGVYYGLAIVAGSGELGRLKAAQTLLGPVVVLLQGGGLLGIPESVRAANDPARLRRLATRLSAVLGLGSLGFGIVMYALLPSIGPSVFPNAWADARPLIPMLAVFTAALGASTGATGALRALGASPWLLRVRMVSGAVLIAVGFVASAWFGANGSLLSLAVVEATVAAIAWFRLMRVTGTPATNLTADAPGRIHLDDNVGGRPVPEPDEAGADPLWPGGGVSLAVIVESLGSRPGGPPGPPPA